MYKKYIFKYCTLIEFAAFIKVINPLKPKDVLKVL